MQRRRHLAAAILDIIKEEPDRLLSSLKEILVKRHLLVLAVACLCAACASGQKDEPAKTGRDLAPSTVPTAGAGTPSTGSGGGTGGTGGGTSGICPSGCETQPPGCFIKGNINLKTGERVYHVPGQRHYDDVTIEAGAGERWFCTEFEAEASGWRRSKR
jgi:hypothetical protein